MQEIKTGEEEERIPDMAYLRGDRKWDRSLRTISEMNGMDVGLAVAVVDDSALQELEITVNLM